MANLLRTLIPLLSSIVVLLLLATARSQSTSFTYHFPSEENDDPPRKLKYQGDAQFNWHSYSLRLTEPTPGKTGKAVGRVIYSSPVYFWRPGGKSTSELPSAQLWQTGGQVDFETTVEFIITPARGKSVAADGITFFVAPVGSTIPSDSGGANLGIFNCSGGSPSVFAVEIDTYGNGEWEPDYPHIGIDIGSRLSRNTTQVDSSIIGQQVTATINYAAATKMIAVRVTAGSKTFEVSYEYDLSSFLPQSVQVGLSAATGEFVASHEIKAWYFTATLVSNSAGNNIRQYV
ncbi:anti-H(O) lectin 1-like [Salvia miltiorrhiza]|uniref:anti-H(O) lectin 1-like n=1 Tax=Salvia miltiorrhiza TaxID=226208 RepID=UPI0025AC5179|nr:anti-H(O) lectin 1-like [Salvia miltiorrhiza]